MLRTRREVLGASAAGLALLAGCKTPIPPQPIPAPGDNPSGQLAAILSRVSTEILHESPERCTSLGALAGMLSGASVAGFYFALTAIEGEKLWSWFGLAGTAIPPFAAAAFGLPVAFAVAVLVSLATPPEPDRARLVEVIRRPAGRPSGEDDD